MDKKAILGVILVFAVLGVLFGGCTEDSEYEKAGKEFGSWVNKGPENWSDTEKKYFNDFMEWSDKN